MKREIEIELKYQILNSDSLESFEKEFPPGKRNVDVYLDTQGGEFFKKGVFIRVRDDSKLDFKFNMEDGKIGKYDHTHCDEYSFQLPFKKEDKVKFSEVSKILGFIDEMDSLELFKKKNNLTELVTVDKLRKTAEKNGFEITLDEIARVGKFIEIEKDINIETESAEEEKIILDKIKSDIKKFGVSLGLKLKEIPIGYCEIVLRTTNFALYKQGRYVMEEDKKETVVSS